MNVMITRWVRGGGESGLFTGCCYNTLGGRKVWTSVGAIFPGGGDFVKGFKKKKAGDKTAKKTTGMVTSPSCGEKKTGTMETLKHVLGGTGSEKKAGVSKEGKQGGGSWGGKSGEVG